MFTDRLLDGIETVADLDKFERELHAAIVAKKERLRKDACAAARLAKAEKHKAEVAARAEARTAEVQVNRQLRQLIKEEEKDNNSILFNLARETFRGRVKPSNYVKFTLYGETHEGTVLSVNDETFHIYVVGHGFRNVQYGKLISVA